MSRTFYSDYVKHALRFYARNQEAKHFKTPIDKDNWFSCDIVLKKCTETEKEMILSVYRGYDTLADELYNTAKKYNINQNVLWDLMKDIEHNIAKKRKLI